MWFHASIIQLFRPFAIADEQSTPEMDGNFARDILAASLNQLKHLVIVFKYTFPRASCAILWHIALLHVANWALYDTANPEWRAYFLLCIDSYTDLFVGFRISGAIAKSLLSMALRLGVIESSEARVLVEQVYSSVIHHTGLERMGSGLVVDLNLALIDHTAAQLDTLCEDFDNIQLEEFIATE